MAKNEMQSPRAGEGLGQALGLPAVFPNYPALCAALGLPVLRGNAKTAQIRRLTETYNIIQSGNSWHVIARWTPEELLAQSTAIAEAKAAHRLAKQSNLDPNVSLNQRKFLLVSEIRDILQSATAAGYDSSGLAVDFSYPQLDTLLGLVNPSFALRCHTDEELEFCSEVRLKNREVTGSLCASLISSGLAGGYKTYSVSFGKVSPGAGSPSPPVVLPAEELWRILEIETKIFQTLGVSGKSEVHLRGLWREFNELRSAALATQLGITSIWSVFVFFTTESVCNWFLESNARLFHRKENLKFELNQVNLDKLEKYMRKTYEDSLSGVKRKTVLVPAGDGFTVVYDDNGEVAYEEQTVEYKIAVKPEGWLERRGEMLRERVALREGRKPKL